MSNNYRIAVSGKSGCGNTTVSTLLAEKLGIKVVNYTFRNLAKEEGLDFEEVCRQAENDPKWDYLVDERQLALANAQPSVLASRLAIWLWKEAHLRIYLQAPLEVRSGRIYKREGGDLQAAVDKTERRDERDHRRYLALYGIDNDDLTKADLVVDVSYMTPDQIVAQILERL